MFNVTLNSISVVSWRLVLWVVETGESHRPAASHLQTLSHNVVSNTPSLSRIRAHNISGRRRRRIFYFQFGPFLACYI